MTDGTLVADSVAVIVPMSRGVAVERANREPMKFARESRLSNARVSRLKEKFRKAVRVESKVWR